VGKTSRNSPIRHGKAVQSRLQNLGQPLKSQKAWVDDVTNENPTSDTRDVLIATIGMGQPIKHPWSIFGLLRAPDRFFQLSQITRIS